MTSLPLLSFNDFDGEKVTQVAPVQSETTGDTTDIVKKPIFTTLFALQIGHLRSQKSLKFPGVSMRTAAAVTHGLQWDDLLTFERAIPRSWRFLFKQSLQ